ncbi:unnamed protein product, partial [Discosporangium mesarthrocarpum]
QELRGIYDRIDGWITWTKKVQMDLLVLVDNIKAIIGLIPSLSETRRSVARYLLLYNRSYIVRRLKLQGAVTLSSSGAEWTAMAQGMCHCVFIRGILIEMGIPQ